ncbi:MAG TPA: DUF3800 domain-containing protein [Povalibacter sp.]|uniref:DUF3800 domain-containing protein n=1 Tax=Povalibacter sp. TaxID=1962978 RepID=UPI002BB34E4D|nr:DUF3800 domain-containing protein [Povalibacter sp.]HMN44223.1 DUF3800 domain-containing protein [Povalibacter sp.]
MTSFVVYVDESGDEGFAFRSDGSGSSRWFVMSALVLRKANDSQAVAVARDIRQLLSKPVNHALHFRNLRHEQRIPVARLIGQMPARTVSILIHKPSIEEPEIFQQQAYALCRYASRLLLERVSWLCRDNRKTDDGDGRAELVFSNRSAMSYDDLRQYLTGLKQEREGRDVRIDWNAIDPARVRAVNHDQLAGLQLADAVATSAYYSVTVNRYGDVEDRYLRSISPTIYRRDGRVEGYGLKFWCSSRDLIDRVIAVVA